MLQAQQVETPKKEIKQRHYRPSFHQIFYDHKNKQYVIILNPYLFSESNKELIEYRNIDGGKNIILTLTAFNDFFEGSLRFTECTNSEIVFKQVNRMDGAIELLKEVLEDGIEDQRLITKINKFLNNDSNYY